MLNRSFSGLDSLQGSSLSLSRSSSREHLAGGSESDNWRDRNGIGPMGHSEFAAPIGSPKRKQNKSSELDFCSHSPGVSLETFARSEVMRGRQLPPET